MTLTYDSTGLVNQLTVVSNNNDDGKPYFQSHIVKDDESIKEYGLWDGGDFSDERYHDANNADNGARATFVTQPSVSVTVDYLDNDEPIPGEIRRLEVLDTGFITNVMVVSYNYFPLDKSQKTSLTLNSNAKTVLDFQRSNRSQLYQSKQNTAALSQAIQETNNQIENLILNQPKSWVVGKIEG